MSTGYTEKITDGISFERFALVCARAFGACISLRDNPMDEDIPEQFEASKYYAESAKKTRDELVTLSLMSETDCEAAALAEFNSDTKYREEYKQEKIAQRAAYEAMLVQVENWTPPTTGHVALRDFMRHQICESIRFDCGGDRNEPVIVLKTGEQWREEKQAFLECELGYAETEYAKGVVRVREATEWVRALRESLK